MLLLLFMALSFGSAAPPTHLGAEPADTLGARDLASEYHLPPFRDRAGDPVFASLQKLQVFSRAQRLGLTSHSATEAWMEAGRNYGRAHAVESAAFPSGAKIFRGGLASELNRMLGEPGPCAVRVDSADLRLDTPVYLRDHCSLDLGRTALHSVGFQPYQIQIKGRTDVRLTGGRLSGGSWGVSITRSSNVTVTGMQMDTLGGGGVMVTNSYGVTVWRNRMRGLGGAGVMLHGDTQHAVVAENEITADTGWSNWHAGIVVTDRNADPGDDATTLLRKDGILVKQTRITDRMTIPHDNLMYKNEIRGNLTSGMYSDGGARNVYVENIIVNNSKEGMCLDNGSTANVVAFNVFRGNGNRWGVEDAVLKRDFVWSFGRLPDGTSPAKLPGISMDNALYNQIVFNDIDRNYGSGVKMVRTSMFNRIGMNTVTDDNEGSNPKLHYFGILVGYAGADESAWDLDFVPSRGNQIFGNNVRGNHFVGIYFEREADHNVVFDNSIFGAIMWGMDSAKQQEEESFNNLSNLPFRNIDSGLDPRLIPLGKGKVER